MLSMNETFKLFHSQMERMKKFSQKFITSIFLTKKELYNGLKVKKEKKRIIQKSCKV